MKKFNKILMSLCAVLLLTTGCSSNALKTAYSVLDKIKLKRLTKNTKGVLL